MFKKTIRKSVFETNSSSTHSITLGKGDFEISKKGLDVEGNIVRIYSGEFGWGPEKFNDAATKASYALTWAKGQVAEEHYLSMLRDVIEKVTGCEVVFYHCFDEDYSWGYIDHRSSNVGAEVFGSEEVLKNFIFNPNSVLRVDNDNH